MNERREDIELLRDFARHGSQPAFASLVGRHLDLVYGTALRKIGDAGGAEEVSQNVFGVLARKAWQFAPDDSLPAWLHRAALLESQSWLRGEMRRRQREQTAAELGTTMKTPEDQPALRALTPMLDEALLSLREKDRAALLLRFYENQSLRELGASLGVGEGAAQKRVATALEKLSAYFQRRGFKTATAAATTAALQHTATAAPATLLGAITQAAPATGSLTLALLSRLMGLTRLQTAVACAAVVAAPCAWEWSQSRQAHQQVLASRTKLQAVRLQEDTLSSEILRLQTQSTNLDAALADTTRAQDRDAEALHRLSNIGMQYSRVLSGAAGVWQEDLPFVRVPKSAVKDFKLEGTFGMDGKIFSQTAEALGLTPAERGPAEDALAGYWKGVDDLIQARAYETNAPPEKPGRVTKALTVPPLGNDVRSLASATAAQLSQVLGPDRERLLFGHCEAGGYQLFWPGNLCNVSENPQNFRVWVDPAATVAGEPSFGAGWDCPGGGGASGQGRGCLGDLGALPQSITAKVFVPFLEQFGITNGNASF